MTAARPIVLLGLVWALVACGGSTSSTDAEGAQGDVAFEGGPTGGDTGTAAVDTGSPGQPTGDAVSSQDAGPLSPEHEAECASDTDCGDVGAVCSCRGECVDVTGANPCTEPKNCGSGSWCDPCTGHCAAVAGLCESCSTAGLCDPSGACRDPEDGGCADQGICIPFASGGSYCGAACLTTAGCPNGYTCVDVEGASAKQCVPVSGVCDELGLCEVDADCPEGEVCQEGPQVCGPGCVDDAGCPVGQVCDQARCVDPCSTDAECVLPELCDPTGHCKDPNACETWTECPVEHYCHKTDGECVPGCQLDEQCADASKVCEDGACVAKGCEHNYQCAFEEECEQATGGCGPMTRPHCSTCDASVDDPAQCGGEPNLCVTFQDSEGVEMGDFCILTCDADPIDSCPQGYGCEHIEAPDAGIDGYYCTRQCWQDPYGG